MGTISYLLAGANNFKGKFEIRPQKVVSGPNGHGLSISRLTCVKQQKRLESRR